MRIVEREDIDDVKWNRIVENSEVQNFILYSWAMDATTENWCAIISGEYDFILPIPYVTNLSVKRARQQVYSRQVDFIGDIQLFPQALDILKSEFQEFDVRISENKFGVTDQKFQYLDLHQEIIYSDNAKRLIKKANKSYSYSLTNDIKPLLELYKSNTHVKLKQPEDNLLRIEQLMKAFMENDKGYALNVIKENQIVASSFIIEDKGTSVYLIGDASPEEKRNGAIYGIMDFAIQQAISKKMKRFDFGGSNVKSVATFYRKFGAKDHLYTRIHWDVTPFWFKLVKKVKWRLQPFQRQ